MANNPKLERKFEDYSYTKSATAALFDAIIGQFDLIHDTDISSEACRNLCATTLILVRQFKVFRAKYSILPILTSDDPAERSLAQFK